MGKEVEMKDAPNGTPPKEEAMVTDDAPAAKPTPISVLQSNVALLEKAVKLKDTRLMIGRVLRQTANIRKQLDIQLLKTFLQETLPKGSSTQGYLLDVLSKVGDCFVWWMHDHTVCTQYYTSTTQADGAMDTDANGTVANGVATPPPTSSIPEVELYAYLLVTLLLCDSKQFGKVCGLVGGVPMGG